MSLLRPLKEHEVYLIVPGGKAFFEEAKLPGVFNIGWVIPFWAKAIREERGQIIGLFDGDTILGAIGFLYAPDLFTAEAVGIECFLFMLPEHRGGSGALKLLKAFEADCRAKKCARIAIIHLTGLNDSLGEIYKRLKFVEIERHFVKSLV